MRTKANSAVEIQAEVIIRLWNDKKVTVIKQWNELVVDWFIIWDTAESIIPMLEARRIAGLINKDTYYRTLRELKKLLNIHS